MATTSAILLNLSSSSTTSLPPALKDRGASSTLYRADPPSHSAPRSSTPFGWRSRRLSSLAGSLSRGARPSSPYSTSGSQAPSPLASKKSFSRAASRSLAFVRSTILRSHDDDQHGQPHETARGVKALATLSPRFSSSPVATPLGSPVHSRMTSFSAPSSNTSSPISSRFFSRTPRASLSSFTRSGGSSPTRTRKSTSSQSASPTTPMFANGVSYPIHSPTDDSLKRTELALGDARWGVAPRGVPLTPGAQPTAAKAAEAALSHMSSSPPATTLRPGSVSERSSTVLWWRSSIVRQGSKKRSRQPRPRHSQVNHTCTRAEHNLNAHFVDLGQTPSRDCHCGCDGTLVDDELSGEGSSSASHEELESYAALSRVDEESDPFSVRPSVPPSTIAQITSSSTAASAPAYTLPRIPPPRLLPPTSRFHPDNGHAHPFSTSSAPALNSTSMTSVDSATSEISVKSAFLETGLERDEERFSDTAAPQLEIRDTSGYPHWPRSSSEDASAALQRCLATVNSDETLRASYGGRSPPVAALSQVLPSSTPPQSLAQRRGSGAALLPPLALAGDDVFAAGQRNCNRQAHELDDRFCEEIEGDNSSFESALRYFTTPFSPERDDLSRISLVSSTAATRGGACGDERMDEPISRWSEDGESVLLSNALRFSSANSSAPRSFAHSSITSSSPSLLHSVMDRLRRPSMALRKGSHSSSGAQSQPGPAASEPKIEPLRVVHSSPAIATLDQSRMSRDPERHRKLDELDSETVHLDVSSLHVEVSSVVRYGLADDPDVAGLHALLETAPYLVSYFASDDDE